MATLNGLYRGQSVEATVNFKNSDGQLADPTTVSFKVRSPSGVVTSYAGDDAAVSHPSAGVYTLTLVVDEAGTWPVYAVGTGVVEASDYGTIQVNRDPF